MAPILASFLSASQKRPFCDAYPCECKVECIPCQPYMFSHHSLVDGSDPLKMFPRASFPEPLRLTPLANETKICLTLSGSFPNRDTIVLIMGNPQKRYPQLSETPILFSLDSEASYKTPVQTGKTGKPVSFRWNFIQPRDFALELRHFLLRRTFAAFTARQLARPTGNYLIKAFHVLKLSLQSKSSKPTCSVAALELNLNRAGLATSGELSIVGTCLELPRSLGPGPLRTTASTLNQPSSLHLLHPSTPLQGRSVAGPQRLEVRRSRALQGRWQKACCRDGWGGSGGVVAGGVFGCCGI